MAIANVKDLNAASYHIAFDTSVLKLINVTQGDISGTVVPVDLWSDAPPGLLGIVQSLSGLTAANGSGYLSRLEFLVVGAAGTSSAITLEHNIDQRVLSDTRAEAIPATWTGATVTITAP